jgi:hypothetical protein
MRLRSICCMPEMSCTLVGQRELHGDFSVICFGRTRIAVVNLVTATSESHDVIRAGLSLMTAKVLGGSARLKSSAARVRFGL